MPIDPVQSADLCIADEGDTDFCVLPEMFCHQNRLTAAANEHTDSHRHPHFGLIIFTMTFTFGMMNDLLS